MAALAVLSMGANKTHKATRRVINFLRLMPLIVRHFSYQKTKLPGLTMFFAIKTLISALIIASVNELSKRSTTMGALLLALPIVSVIAFTWEWIENHDAQRIAALSSETFWFVLPTLPMFLLLSWLLKSGMNYFAAMGICVIVTAVLFAVVQYFQR
jgi:hypothetical protein